MPPEAYLVALAILFLFAPLPICVYLLVQRKRLSERMGRLELQLEQLKRDRTSQPAKIEFDEPAEVEEPLEETSTGEESAFLRAVESTPAPAKPEPRERTELENPKTEEAPQKSPASLPKLLRSMGLLPPADMNRTEAGIIQWWTLRLGGLLAVLTAIFFSVYISKNTSPLIRFMELMAVDAAVIGLGTYFRKKRARFGSIILAIGLCMLYVSVVSGYAASPVRVITNPFIGIAAQFAVIAFIYTIAVKLREHGIAFLATLLGFASSIFAAYVGLNEGALLSAVILQLLGAAFGYRWKHLPLFALSTLAVYLPLLALCLFLAIDSTSLTLPWNASILIFLAISVSTFPFIDWKWNLRNRFSATAYRFLAVANTTLFASLGYSYTKLSSGDLTNAYGIFALLFISWAVLYIKTGLRSLAFQLFFLKGSGLAALWFVNYFSGEIRWFALGVQAILMAWSTRQSKSTWSELATFALYAVACLLAFWDLLSSRSVAVWSIPFILYFLLPILGTAALGLQLDALTQNKARKTIYFLAGISSGGLLCLFSALNVPDEAQIPLYLAGLAIATGCLATIPRFYSIPVIASSAVCITIGHFVFWSEPENLWSFVAITAVSILFAYQATRRVACFKSKASNLPELTLLGLSVISTYWYFYSGYETLPLFPLFAPAFSVVLRLVRIRPFRTLGDLFLIPLLVNIGNLLSSESSFWIHVLSLALCYCLFFGSSLRPRFERNLYFLRTWGLGRKLGQPFITALILTHCSRIEDWFQSQGILLAATVLFFLLWRLQRHRTSLICSVFLSLISLSNLYETGNFYSDQSPWSWQFLSIGLSFSVFALLAGTVVSFRTSRKIREPLGKVLIYLATIASYLAAAITLAYPGLSLDSYYTPIIAVYCLGLISLGIALKVKPFRIVALAGFVLPVGRLFLVDIQETLHRIIAFAVLAVLFTTIGYLYNRFASRID
ncbi:hypothetical protein [Pelagicoccus albus]|uniref:DUF2339 domain-containing protein n=1 Tax=Pelagicoccus albus TaxID=415222 RepID=A0A7X1B7L0_9BACT|nr:hypothetical protein [Pelagicoccus albus]MBC2605865.1 hypothetical protein [Pelagicoccus albus]